MLFRSLSEDRPPPCAARMEEEDGHLELMLRVSNKRRIFYEGVRGGLIQKMFSKDQYRKIGPDNHDSLIFDLEVMMEELIRLMESKVGVTLPRPKWHCRDTIWVAFANPFWPCEHENLLADGFVPPSHETAVDYQISSHPPRLMTTRHLP